RHLKAPPRTKGDSDVTEKDPAPRALPGPRDHDPHRPCDRGREPARESEGPARAARGPLRLDPGRAAATPGSTYPPRLPRPRPPRPRPATGHSAARRVAARVGLAALRRAHAGARWGRAGGGGKVLADSWVHGGGKPDLSEPPNQGVAEGITPPRPLPQAGRAD